MPAYKYTTPSWANPDDASVFDSAFTKAIRILAGLVGADDPQSQVVGLMNPMETAAPGGLMGALGRVGKKIKAYHGSPHDFDKFALDKIGTGEGAQAYGHGLYFAENEATARAYRDALASQAPVKIGNEPVRLANDATNVDGIAAGWVKLASKNGATDPLATAKQMAAHGYDGPDVNKAVVAKIDEWIQRGATVEPNTGKTYEVAINADPEDFLDWDRPLSQQSEKVRQALNQDMSAIADTAANPDIKQKIRSGALKGEKAYHLLGGEKHVSSGFTTPPPQAAAAALRERGVPGLKYYDSGSRTAAGGFSSADRAGADLTRNYVVFDDSIIEILRKYGLLLPASGAALAAGSGTSAPAAQEQAPSSDLIRQHVIKLLAGQR